MQILVVVAIIQMRILKAEVEKGSMRTVIGHGLLDPKAMQKRVIFSVSLSCQKGMGLIFLKLAVDYCGNANELGDIGTYFWKSYLFFLTPQSHGIGLPRDMALWEVEQFTNRTVRSVRDDP